MADTITYTMRANTADQAVREVVRHCQSEAQRMHRMADLTTGRDKKDWLVRAAYAESQMMFWANMEVQPKEPA